MIDKTQYIETLIKLIKLNKDQEWTSTFINLRTGANLPGGGAGSLNDWGPSYKDDLQDVWYSGFYGIMRFLFENNLEPDAINQYREIVNLNKFRILRCLDCDYRYQHPSRFESHVAMKFYQQNTAKFYYENRLIDILNPLESYKSPSVKSYRDWLSSEYTRLGIKIYDFISAKYVCHHCGAKNSGTEHDLYKLEKTFFGKMKLTHIKNNGEWDDFE